jgi:hypothetical protein
MMLQVGDPSSRLFYLHLGLLGLFNLHRHDPKLLELAAEPSARQEPLLCRARSLGFCRKC